MNNGDKAPAKRRSANEVEFDAACAARRCARRLGPLGIHPAAAEGVAAASTARHCASVNRISPRQTAAAPSGMARRTLQHAVRCVGESRATQRSNNTSQSVQGHRVIHARRKRRSKHGWSGNDAPLSAAERIG